MPPGRASTPSVHTFCHNDVGHANETAFFGGKWAAKRDDQRDVHLDVTSDDYADRIDVVAGATGRRRWSHDVKARSTAYIAATLKIIIDGHPNNIINELMSWAFEKLSIYHA